ncbi:Involucrin [Galemys pyrenaicus]|uniref:Involucrin n=1 Tax=Galemys pyrenaicus TaxID=202257 RepID=A0A8J6DDQ1_GALPY|nr:Involucrin [Galemys pyrenaicus]
MCYAEPILSLVHYLGWAQTHAARPMSLSHNCPGNPERYTSSVAPSETQAWIPPPWADHQSSPSAVCEYQLHLPAHWDPGLRLPAWPLTTDFSFLVSHFSLDTRPLFAGKTKPFAVSVAVVEALISALDQTNPPGAAGELQNRQFASAEDSQEPLKPVCPPTDTQQEQVKQPTPLPAPCQKVTSELPKELPLQHGGKYATPVKGVPECECEPQPQEPQGQEQNLHHPEQYLDPEQQEPQEQEQHLDQQELQEQEEQQQEKHKEHLEEESLEQQLEQETALKEQELKEQVEEEKRLLEQQLDQEPANKEQLLGHPEKYQEEESPEQQLEQEKVQKEQELKEQVEEEKKLLDQQLDQELANREEQLLGHPEKHQEEESPEQQLEREKVQKEQELKEQLEEEKKLLDQQLDQELANREEQLLGHPEKHREEESLEQQLEQESAQKEQELKEQLEEERLLDNQQDQELANREEQLLGHLEEQETRLELAEQLEGQAEQPAFVLVTAPLSVPWAFTFGLVTEDTRTNSEPNPPQAVRAQKDLPPDQRPPGQAIAIKGFCLSRGRGVTSLEPVFLDTVKCEQIDVSVWENQELTESLRNYPSGYLQME